MKTTSDKRAELRRLAGTHSVLDWPTLLDLLDDFDALLWQPIDSAPKDGSKVLVFRPGGEFQKRGPGMDNWSVEFQHWRHSAMDNRPTHWRSLDEPVPALLSQERSDGR